MPQFNVHDAKTQFSKLLEMVEKGEEVIIARHGKAVARLVRVEENNILGSGVGDPNYRADLSDEAAFSPMNAAEADSFFRGQQ